MYIISSPLPLKIPTRAHHRDALIHQGLADPEVVLDPALEVGGFGEGVGFDAGAGGFSMGQLGSGEGEGGG